MNELLEAALAYAARGWPVFGAMPDKRPYPGTHGVLDATTNPEKIKAFWEKHPNANIALDVGGAGMLAIDLDPGHAPDFLETLPPTELRQRTPRGGQHLFFALNPGEIVAPSASKLAPHVDVRSFNSYVLLAPSKTQAGAYVWESEGKPAFRSDDLLQKCNARREKSADRDSWTIAPDLPENIDLAETWLAKEAKIATEGQGGDHAAYATAAMLRSFGLSEEMALDCMWRVWNPRCQPPWGPEDFDHFTQKVTNGYSYATSPPGNLTDAYRIAKQQKMFSAVERPLPTGHEFTAGRFRFVDRDGMLHIRPPEWLIEDFLPDEAFAFLFGAPGSLKTFLALDIALSIATGGLSPELLWGGKVRKAGNVLFAVGEGRARIAERIGAWESRHFDGNRAEGIILADPVPNVVEALDPFIEGALAASPHGYRLVVLDTVGRAMQGVNENSQEHASKFTAMVERIQAELGSTVLAIHHTGHEKKDRTKGSMEFIGAADTMVRADRAGKNDATVCLSMTKQKDAPEWPKSAWAQAEPVNASLAIVRMDPAKIEEQQQERVEKAHPSQAIAYSVYEAVAVDRLKANPTAKFSETKLAQAMRTDDRIEVVSDKTVTRALGYLRGQNDSPLKVAYDALSGTYQGRLLP